MSEVEKIYHNKSNSRREFFSFVKSSIKKGDTLLDAGCGDGFNSIIMKNLDKNSKKKVKIIGVDLFKKNLDKNNYIDKKIHGDLNNLSKLVKKKVDIIYSEYVFEHLEDPIKVIKEMHKILKPGGKIFLILPNSKNPVSFLNRTIPHKVSVFYLMKILRQKRVEDQIFPAYYRFNIKRIKEASKMFKKIKVHYYNAMKTYFKFSIILKWFCNMYENTFKNQKIANIIILEK